MKLPLWYKDRNGKWKNLPPEIFRCLHTFEDGKQGVTRNGMKDANYFVSVVPTEDFWEIFDRHDPRYILKEHKLKEHK